MSSVAYSLQKATKISFKIQKLLSAQTVQKQAAGHTWRADQSAHSVCSLALPFPPQHMLWPGVIPAATFEMPPTPSGLLPTQQSPLVFVPKLTPRFLPCSTYSKAPWIISWHSFPQVHSHLKKCSWQLSLAGICPVHAPSQDPLGLCFSVPLVIEPGALCMLSTVTELQPSPKFKLNCITKSILLHPSIYCKSYFHQLWRRESWCFMLSVTPCQPGNAPGGQRP